MSYKDVTTYKIIMRGDIKSDNEMSELWCAANGRGSFNCTGCPFYDKPGSTYVCSSPTQKYEEL